MRETTPRASDWLAGLAGIAAAVVYVLLLWLLFTP